MITKRDIQNFLKSAQITKSDTVLIHTSMRSLGKVENGCDGVINAFTDYLSEGLLIVPTHSWDRVNKENPLFNAKTTGTCLGALPETALLRKDGVRSLHPTHSVKAFGKRAKEFVSGEERATSPCFIGGVWNRLHEEDAKILLIGVTLNKNTYIHAIDEMLCFDYKLNPPFLVSIVGGEGNVYKVNYSNHGTTYAQFNDNFAPALYYHGALKKLTLGNAEVLLFNVRKGTEVIKNIYNTAGYDVLEKGEEIPEKFYIKESL